MKRRLPVEGAVGFETTSISWLNTANSQMEMKLNKCICGCDEQTKGGRFRPGHDQKLRAAIENAAGGLEELRVIVEKHIGRTITTKIAND